MFCKGIQCFFEVFPGLFLVSYKVFRGVPGFLEVVPGYSGFSESCSGVFRVFWHCFRCFGVFRGIPVFRVSVFLELLHALHGGCFNYK